MTTAIVSAPNSVAEAGNHGRGASACPAAKARRHEDHVGAGELLDDRVGVLERRLPADVGIGPGAKPLRQLGSDLNLDAGLVVVERLHVGVGHDEFDTAQPDLHHAVDRIAASATYANHFDPGAIPMFWRQRQAERVRLATLAPVDFFHVRPPDVRTSHLKEFLENRPELRHDAAERTAGTPRFGHSISMRVERDAHWRRKDRTADVIGEAANANRHASPDRQIENLFRDFRHALENGAAASEDDARVQ